MKISGTITLMNWMGDFIDSKKYYNKKYRQSIIDKWRLLYPKNTLFIIIKPDIND
jgi:hypothetical protein